MDDLIVIILTLLFAGFGVLGQIKKKKQAESGEGGTAKPNDFWGLLQGENLDAQQMEYEGEEEPDFEEEQIAYTQKAEVNLKSSLYDIKSYDNAKPVLKNGVKKTNGEKLKSLIGEDFSLRKAVIYSEILNRKYN